MRDECKKCNGLKSKIKQAKDEGDEVIPEFYLCENCQPYFEVDDIHNFNEEVPVSPLWFNSSKDINQLPDAVVNLIKLSSKNYFLVKRENWKLIIVNSK